jgi:hypothetical protein
VHQLGITGYGVNVGLITYRNANPNHPAFIDANGQTGVFNYDYSGSGINWNNSHDTIFAGIIKSRGTPAHPNDIGTAPDCTIHCGRVVSNSGGSSCKETALLDLIENKNCRVITAGIQGTDYYNADGGSQWTLMCDYLADACDVIFAHAAGNYISDTCGVVISRNITIPGDAYNGITTGGLAESPTDNYSKVGSNSAIGYTLDGRRKPDIVTPSTYQVAPAYDGGWNPGSGNGATSWAVPHTAGVAALLLEYTDSTEDADDGHNEVIKAVIVNSTFPNIKDRLGQNTDPTVWHTQRGYGRIDALRAYQTLSADRITKNIPTTAMLGWAYDTMGSYATHYYYIAGKKNERLVLTVTWNRKPTKTGSTYFDESNKFNIELKVAQSTAPEPNLFSETDLLNNLEKVDILLPADGNYTITLTNATDKSGRDYALAFERLPAIAGDFNVNYIVDGNDLSRLVESWLETDADINIVPDDTINWFDFTYLANNWLKIDHKYYTE